jgi:hypothetical protein
MTLTSTPNIVVIKSVRLGGTCNMGEMRNTEFWSEDLKGRDHFGDPWIGGKVILK